MRIPPVPPWLPRWLLLLTAALFLAGVITFEGTVVGMLLCLSLIVRTR